MIAFRIKSMANLVVSLAEEKARTLKKGDRFEVTVPSVAIPPGEDAHYGEIIEPLRTLALKKGLKLHVAEARNDFTYPFTKL